MIRIERSSLAAYKFSALCKHTFISSYTCNAPFITNINGGKSSAPGKHLIHIHYLTCVKTTEIYFCQIFAVYEHGIHYGNLAGIEVAYVKTGKILAISEHISQSLNVVHMTCVEIF